MLPAVSTRNGDDLPKYFNGFTSVIVILFVLCELGTEDFFFYHGATVPPVGQGLLIIEASRSHSDTQHSVGLLRTSGQPVAEPSI